jgi:transposase
MKEYSAGSDCGVSKGRERLEQLPLAPWAAKRRQDLLGLLDLAFVLIIGYPERFRCGKQIGSYVGLIPEEASSGVHRRLGHISKQGSSLLRFLLVQAAQAAARFNPEWRSKFLHLAMRRERRIVKVAMARKLAVNLYWMWRKQRSLSRQ